MLILPQAAYAASLSKEKVVFAGDFMQLPPIYNTDNKHPSYDVVKKWLGHVFDQVNIEKRINNKEKNIIALKRQYRMNEKICKLINKYFYDNTLITDESVKKSQKKYPKILNDNLIVVDTASANPFCPDLRCSRQRVQMACPPSLPIPKQVASLRLFQSLHLSPRDPSDRILIDFNCFGLIVSNLEREIKV